MKHIFTGLTALATSLTALAQPDCTQIIQASFLSTVQGNVVVVTNTSASQFPQATTYQWYFGDGGTSDGDIVTHVYDAPGTYLLCLYAIVENCVDTVCQEVVIGGGDPCLALADVVTNVVSQQGGVSFAYANVPSYATTMWYFGDGTGSDDEQGYHQYAEPGTYTVCLWTWFIIEGTTDTCSNETCHPVTIEGGQGPCDGLQAGFFANVQPGAVQFSNATTGTGFQTTWNWSFGDGTTSNDAQPLHEYDLPGGYLVCLTAISIYEQSGGGVITCVDTTCQEVTAPGGGSPCDGLNADFNVSVQGSMAMIDNTLSSNEYTYVWDFGDGTEGYGSDPMHTYSGPGTYQICLLMWGWDPFTQDTCFADHCEWITLGEPDPCDSLFACFQWGLQNTTAQFYNCSGPNGQDLNYWWSFGDGINGDGSQPTHTYPGPGTYVVCLTVFANNSPDSCSNTFCNTLVIGGGGSPCDSLSADFVVTIQENIAAFSSFGGNAIGYQWNFGDGTSGDGPAPVHTYPGPGTYQACLITWTWNPFTQDTCYADYCEWITIGGGEPCDTLQAGFQANVGDATVWFSNTTVGTGFQTTWHWDFGDGTMSDDPQPSHIFPGLGTYVVCLTVTSIFEQQGGGVITCQDSTCQVVVTGGSSPCDSLSAEFVVTTQENFAAFTTFGGTAFGYQWNFGDGTEGDGPAPTHTYPGNGTYYACLVTWTWDPQTQDTCYADHCEWITIGSGTPCDSLEAHFVWEPAGPNVFLFQDASETNGQDVSYWWSFGDGTNADGANPDHAYQQPGEYTVCLTITALDSPDSCSSTTCQTIIVQAGGSPCDGLNAEFTPSVSGYAVAAQAALNPPGTSFEWLFGDGTFGNGPNATHTYAGPGTYNLCLIVGNYDPVAQDSCFEDHCLLITLQGGVSACDSLWTASFEFGHQGNEYTFYNTSNTQGAEVGTLWDFGDGTFGDGSQLIHTYTMSGLYTVCMTITGFIPGTDDTCQVEVCQNIEISVGIDDLAASSSLDAWPQPFDGLLRIAGTGLQGSARIALLDMTGRLLDDRAAFATGHLTLDYGNLPTGTYLLRVHTDMMDRSLRVVKR